MATVPDNYVGPQAPAGGYAPGYPKWLYHPTNPPQIVVSDVAVAALVATDSLWQDTDPNATV